MTLFEDLDEVDCIDIFDLLQYESQGFVQFWEIYTLLLFSSADESR